MSKWLDTASSTSPAPGILYPLPTIPNPSVLHNAAKMVICITDTWCLMQEMFVPRTPSNPLSSHWVNWIPPFFPHLHIIYIIPSQASFLRYHISLFPELKYRAINKGALVQSTSSWMRESPLKMYWKLVQRGDKELQVGKWASVSILL